VRPRTNRHGSWAMPGDLIEHEKYDVGIVIETSPPNFSKSLFRKTLRVYFPHMNKSMWCLGDKMNIVSFGSEDS